MCTRLILGLLLIALLSSSFQETMPDLKNKKDLKLLGSGTILEKDKTKVKHIELYEVKDFWIVYIKDGSLHNMLMENIDHLEFPESKWGPLEIGFSCNKPGIHKIIEGSSFLLKKNNP